MQVLFQNIKEDFKKYNKISRYILKIGTGIIIFLVIIALITKILIVTRLTSLPLEFFYYDLLECTKESFGAIYFGAFILEILYQIYIKNK